MIRYTLQCQDRHQFEAWFPNSAAFDTQAAAGIVTCPECGSHSVEKAIMAPRIGKGGGALDVGHDAGVEAPDSDRTPAAPDEATAGPPMAAPPAPVGVPVMTVSSKLREALHEMKRYVEANAENVGDSFAREARKIHSGEAEERNIYGETTDEEAEELREEGVPFGRIPWPKSSDA